MKVRQLALDALEEIGVRAADEPGDDADLDLALRTIIRMADAFQADRLMLYAVGRAAYHLVANQQTYLIGTGAADFSTPRPLWLAEPCGVIPVGFDEELPLALYTRAAWFAEPFKTLTDLYPQAMLYEPTFPYGTITVWPKPTTAAQIVLATPTALTAPLTLETEITLPPGYQDAWHYNLAKRLCRPFELPVDPDLKVDARDALSRVKRLNDEAPPPSRSDAALLQSGGFEIRSNRTR